MFDLITGRPEDAERVSTFARQTFHDTFAAENSARDLAQYLDAAFQPEIQRAHLQDSRRLITLALSDGELIGYSQLNFDEPEPSVASRSPVELMRLYVDATWKGRGLAHQLMESALQDSFARGATTIWLGVWERNLRARAFYEKWGFSEVGSHIFMLGEDPQKDLILSRGTGLSALP